ncbi:hypothetical protein AB0C52_13105 [Streptomyces sp. NPDC048717]|uniref:hypothetical protein n=1 Tax=Streptomyces sp. NPDC048717 TaxID=3154928 RepID=UPI00341795C3
MATTARTRKTASKTADADSNEATTAAKPSTAPQAAPAPDAAPLEPPHVEEAPQPPAPSLYVTPTGVIPDDQHLAEVILDEATGQPPANLDAVFTPLTMLGSAFTCTIRLVEQTYLGPHRNPVVRLLQPKGAVVSSDIATRIRRRLEAQAARTATGE